MFIVEKKFPHIKIKIQLKDKTWWEIEAIEYTDKILLYKSKEINI